MRRGGSLASLALFGVVGPVAGAGCAAGFEPISQVDGLRVLAVVADKPYANPGDTIHFTMYTNGAGANPFAPDAGGAPLTVAWIAGCFDPAGDAYYGCYAQLGPELEALSGGTSSGTSGFVGLGDTFDLTLPDDIISRRPATPAGQPRYGVGFVFFAACAGELRPVAAEGSGLAGSFPVGCFDAAGNQLGADSFVPGYTEVFSFADGRTNSDPVIQGFTISAASTAAGSDAGTVGFGDAGADGGGPDVDRVPACSLSEAARNASGCSAPNPFTTCSAYPISVVVPPDVAELDPGTRDANGDILHEVVWVDYFADQGDIQDPVMLVSDATLGLQSDFSTLWIPPPASTVANLWAVVYDSRGGVAITQRQVTVE